MRMLGLIAAIGSSVLVNASALAGTTVWDFQAGLTPTTGVGAISYRGDTASVVQFGTASGFGLPLLPGGDSGVIRVPGLSAARGLLVDHASPPNGVHVVNGWTSNYTIVMDVLWPTASSGRWRSYYNTNLTNANDGDFFADPADAIGVSGHYRGRLLPNTWHRVVFVVGAADSEGQMQKYIDGEFVGGQGTTGSAISSRWALFSQPGPDFILFGDDNGETAEVYVSSLMVVDRRMLQEEVRLLGGPTAAGAGTAGQPFVIPPGTARRVEVIAHRGDSAHAPENTLAALGRAWDVGAHTCEIDIRLAAGGVAVLMHDSDVARTTSGTGPVTGFTVPQLQTLDAGVWFDDAFAGERAPTLLQALQFSRGRGRLYLDVKVDGMGPAIKAALDGAGMTGADIWCWVYSEASRLSIVNNVPGAQIVWSSAPATTDDAAFQALQALGAVGFDLNMSQLRSAPAGFVDGARRNGMFVSVYTILDQQIMLEAINLGVDMMETDFPETLFSLMTPPPPACPGDANGDGMVGLPDIAAVINDWGLMVPPGTGANLDGSGNLGLSDLAEVIQNWGTVCP